MGTCEDATHEAIKFLLGALISTGLFISYLPQFHKIISTKSSEGISSHFLFFGAIGCISTFFNMILLQFPSLKCCVQSDWTFAFCIENTLGLIQVSVQFTCFMLVFILYYIYFPIERKTEPLITSVITDQTPLLPPSTPSQTQISTEWKESLQIAAVVSTFFTVTLVLSIWSLIVTPGSAFVLLKSVLDEPTRVEYLAGVLGIIATATSFFMWLPQIYKTFKEQRVGSLSIPMIAMQTPGSFVFVYSLMLQPGANWTSWISFLVAGIQQALLLVLCLSFQNNDRQ